MTNSPANAANNRSFDPEVNPSKTYASWKKLAHKPGGKRVFSVLASFMAPYFATIVPSVEDMRPGYARVHSPKWYMVQNHIGTYHAIAGCNVAEMAMGMMCEASVPATHRWLPMGMRTKYTAKTTGGVTAEATATFPDWSTITRESGGVKQTVNIAFKDAAGKSTIEAEIDVWLTAKK